MEPLQRRWVLLSAEVSKCKGLGLGPGVCTCNGGASVPSWTGTSQRFQGSVKGSRRKSLCFTIITIGSKSSLAVVTA